ncbi:MAG: exodeoxyribonuclease VII small subunit [Planctomycetes bacterium]|nr:exodeoxyribonuclease VII small subunit [Planctomycetota bacterium]
MAARNKDDSADTPPDAGFDQRLERLEALVGELEHGGLGLEASIARYQEGVKLLRECRTTLESFRKRVEELGADGTSAPFAGDPDARAGGG